MTSAPVEPSVQHTPGPWRVGEARSVSALVVYADTGSICDVWYWRQRDAECRANAALIAQAPDYAERLSKAVGALRWIEANAEDTSERGWSPEYMKSVLHDIREQARLSAQEAEGRQA